MKKLFLLTWVLTGTCFQIFGQTKKPLGEEAYFEWKSIEKTQLSADGEWLVYELNPNKGDGQLVVRNTRQEREYRIDRAKNAHLDTETGVLTCLVSLPQIRIDSLKRAKVKEKDFPGDTLVLLNLAEGSLSRTPEVKSVQTPEKWDGWVFYTLQPGTDSLESRVLPRKLAGDESLLIVQNLQNGHRDTFDFVRSYILAEEAPVIYVHQNAADSSRQTSIHYNQLSENQLKTVYEGLGQIKNLHTSKDGQSLTFLADPDTTQHAIFHYDLYQWSVSDTEPTLLVSSNEQNLPNDWIISGHFQAYFSPEKEKLFFGLAPVPALKDTTLLPSEVVDVEIWHYQDQVLYTQQEVREKDERNRSYLYSYDLAENALIPLGRPSIPTIKPHKDRELDWVIGLDDQSMHKTMSWEGKVYKNLYLVSTVDGSPELIKKAISGNPEWSPAGRYIWWYEAPDTTWYVYDLEEEQLINLTRNDPGFSDELNDQPNDPQSYGLMGWTRDDRKVYLYDRYDIWEIDPSNPASAVRITQGREEKISYRYVQMDREEKYLPEGPWLLREINQLTKDEGYLLLDATTGKTDQLMGGSYRLDRSPVKARQSDEIIFTRETFVEFPDLYLCRNFDFGAAKKMSEANPQQEEYRWGTTELVKWNSFVGQELEGLLVKPENFDPTRKYPLIVNFYERSSDDLHNHRAPAPHRSTINYSYYASNGYVIFNPDVVYKIGYPGESAYNAVVSGTQSLLELGFIDPERIALQGHSWGGYQIAHILTKTNMFACAESGAPVVNMVSAYGGIRWETGLSRMFQYEHTQSRLGATLWERPDLYLDNSPIFNLDKIETPVLILHNDADGAVPWYQGIEFFVAMRRLGKPAWLLNYNGEPHWPVKWQNRLDFNRRLFQFFEHYLKDTPMPAWMKHGVPAVSKGIETGLEFTKEGSDPQNR